MAASLRPLRAWMPVLMLLAGLVTGLLLRLFAPAGGPLTLVLWIGIPFAVGMGGALLWWRMIDEVAREAHKTAWFWGGSMGALIATMAFVAAARISPELFELGLEGPTDYIVLGVVGVLGAQMLGYGLVWAGWWMTRR